METKSITINIPEGKIPVWTELNGMTLLTLEDEIDNRPVTERIKTFNDAKKELGDIVVIVLLEKRLNQDPQFR